MSGWAAVGAAAGNILGTGLGTLMNYKASRSLRRHAYQDTMNDMRSAGLNPILAYKTGPSPTTNVGIQSQLGNQMVDAANSTATQKQQRLLMWQQAVTSGAQASHSHAMAKYVEEQQDLLAEQVHSAQMGNEVRRSFLKAMKNKGQFKSNNEWLQYIDALSESFGKMFGAGSSARDLFK
jgi:hypothetical protein